MKDIDGNIYKTVKIGTQIWMAENLKTAKYNDGTTIPLVTDGTAWEKLNAPGYCWYNNDSVSNKKIYGALYNFYAVSTNKICPVGWHVPSDSEWEILFIDYLGGDMDLVYNKLDESGQTHWNHPDTKATNESGFTALPGGTRNEYGAFELIRESHGWWSSTGNSTSNFWGRIEDAKYGIIYKSPKRKGCSIRCIKDK
jgi:uncharacterized protein (TIGR02145 family)